MSTFITILAYPLLILASLRFCLLFMQFSTVRGIVFQEALGRATVKAFALAFVCLVWIICYHCGVFE